MKPYGWDTGPEWEALNQLIGQLKELQCVSTISRVFT